MRRKPSRTQRRSRKNRSRRSPRKILQHLKKNELTRIFNSLHRLLHLGIRRWLHHRKCQSDDPRRGYASLVARTRETQRMLTDEEQLDSEIMFIRSLVCAFIGQAVEDLQKSKSYKSEYVNTYVNRDRETARKFLDSKAFLEICEALNLPADKIRTRANAPRD